MRLGMFLNLAEGIGYGCQNLFGDREKLGGSPGNSDWRWRLFPLQSLKGSLHPQPLALGEMPPQTKPQRGPGLSGSDGQHIKGRKVHCGTPRCRGESELAER